LLFSVIIIGNSKRMIINLFLGKWWKCEKWTHGQFFEYISTEDLKFMCFVSS
jgi:hypothetical protein